MAQINYPVGILSILERESWLSREEIRARLHEIYRKLKEAERASWLATTFPRSVDFWLQPTSYWTARYLVYLRSTGDVKYRERPGKFERHLWWQFPVREYALTARGCYWKTRLAAYQNARTLRGERARAARPAHA